MSNETKVAISFVRAIEHGHIPQDELEDAADVFVRSKDVAVRNKQRETLETMIASMDDAVRQIDVSHG
jgi:hypothetical protein